MTRLVPLLAAIAVLSGFDACESTFNVPPLRRYAEKLVTSSGAQLSIGRCAMLGASRKGYCMLEGSSPELATFTTKLDMSRAPANRVYDALTCLSLAEFGERDGGALVPKAGIQRFAPRAALPANSDNVRLVAVYRGVARACVEMEYPYG